MARRKKPLMLPGHYAVMLRGGAIGHGHRANLAIIDLELVVTAHMLARYEEVYRAADAATAQVVNSVDVQPPRLNATFSLSLRFASSWEKVGPYLIGCPAVESAHNAYLMEPVWRRVKTNGMDRIARWTNEGTTYWWLRVYCNGIGLVLVNGAWSPPIPWPALRALAGLGDPEERPSPSQPRTVILGGDGCVQEAP